MSISLSTLMKRVESKRNWQAKWQKPHLVIKFLFYCVYLFKDFAGQIVEIYILPWYICKCCLNEMQISGISAIKLATSIEIVQYTLCILRQLLQKNTDIRCLLAFPFRVVSKRIWQIILQKSYLVFQFLLDSTLFIFLKTFLCSSRKVLIWHWY